MSATTDPTTPGLGRGRSRHAKADKDPSAHLTTRPLLPRRVPGRHVHPGIPLGPQAARADLEILRRVLTGLGRLR
jgi:hypothetical protein